MLERERNQNSSTSSAIGESNAPDIFDFLNYREFLRDWLEWKKRNVPHYSGTLFAAKAGISSHNLLGMVIRGERNLGLSTIQGFIKACQLKARAAQYFERLVLYNQAKDSVEQAEYFEQLVQLGRKQGLNNFKTIQNYGQYLKGWYVVAIRELVHLKDFQADPEWIAKRLKRKVHKKEIEEAWQSLIALELVKWDPDRGRYIIVDQALVIDVAKVDFCIRNFHRDYLLRAQAAIDGETMKERNLSSLTIAVSNADIDRLKERITEFRKQLNAEFSDSNHDKDQVVAINTQFLVLTDLEEPEKEKTREGEDS